MLVILSHNWVHSSHQIILFISKSTPTIVFHEYRSVTIIKVIDTNSIHKGEIENQSLIFKASFEAIDKQDEYYRIFNTIDYKQINQDLEYKIDRNNHENQTNFEWIRILN